MRLIKLLVVLVLAAVIALVGYAYLGDMEPNRREIREPIAIQDGALSASSEASTAAAETPEDASETGAAGDDATDAQAAPATEEDTTEAPGD